MADQKLSELREVTTLTTDDLVYVSSSGSKKISKENLENTLKPDRSGTADNSLQLGGINSDQFVQSDGTNSNFIDVSTGVPDAGKPIALNQHGLVDQSMVDLHGFTYIGSWTPTAGVEYPDITGVDPGSFWTVDGLSSDYTFTGGDLVGQVATNNSLMIWGSNGWTLSESSLEPNTFYKLDGSDPITANFAGGGHRVTNIADGINDADAVTMGQILGLGGYLPIDGKAADSELLDGVDSSGYVHVDGDEMTGNLVIGTAQSNASLNLTPIDDAGYTSVILRDGTGFPRGTLYTRNNINYMGLQKQGASNDVVCEVALEDSGNISLQIPNVSPQKDNDLATKKYVDDHSTGDDVFLKTEHISTSTGPSDGGKPIILNGQGEIDPSMLDVSVFYFVSEFTPATGAEYPDTTGEEFGAFWIVESLTADYTFEGGDLIGRVISNGDFMVWATGGWSIMASEMNPTLYYRLDGSSPLTNNFQAGGFSLKSVGAGVDGSDAITLGQADSSYLPLTGKAVDSDLLDSHDSSYFSPSSHDHHGEYLPLTGKAADSELLDGREGSSFVYKEGDVMTGTLSLQRGDSVVFFGVNRPDSTKKMWLGSNGTSESAILRLYNTAGDTAVCGLTLKPDGNIESHIHPTPVELADFTTKSYVDTQDALSYLETEHVSVSDGPDDAFKPITLNANGDVDVSMIDFSVFTYMGTFTPATGAEYPDNTGLELGSFWAIQGLPEAGYEFITGDLIGIITTNEDLLVWGEQGWSLIERRVDFDVYYKRDGSYAMTGNVACGGYQIKNVADGVDTQDAITVAQLNAGLATKLDTTAKAADSDLLDGNDSLYFAKQNYGRYTGNVDDLKSNSWHSVSDETTGLPPDYNWGTLLVFGNDENLTTQIFVPIDDGVMYFRSYANGAWVEWNKIIDGTGDQEINGNLSLSSPNGKLSLSSTTAVVDEKEWGIIALEGGGLLIRAYDDTGGTADPMSMVRTGLNIDRIDLTADNIYLNGRVRTGMLFAEGSINLLSDQASVLHLKESNDNIRGVVGCTGAAGDNRIFLKTYTEDGSGGIVTQLILNSSASGAEFNCKVLGVDPTTGAHLATKTYVDKNYLRGNGAALPFDGTDRVFAPEDSGFWVMTGYNIDWTSVGYPDISGGTAWTRISITGDYGHQSVWGYMDADLWSRKLYNGVWGAWEKAGSSGLHVSVRFDDAGNIHQSYGISSIVANGGSCQVTFAQEMIDTAYQISGMAGGADGTSTETFCNMGPVEDYLTTGFHARTVHAADNSDDYATGHTVMNAYHPNMANITEARPALSVENIGVIENQDLTIRILNPATGWSVQECLDQIGETGSIMPRSNVPANTLFWDAWRLDSVNNTIIVDLSKVKDIVIGKNEKVVGAQLAAIRPAWEEAVDNDDTTLMNQIKIDRKDIRDELADKIADINAATTVAEVENYLP